MPTSFWRIRASALATTFSCCAKARAKTGGLGDWWTDYQEANDSERRNMIRGLSGKDDAGATKKRRRGGRRRRTPGDAANPAD